MAKYVNADILPKYKYHPLPYTHIFPPDVVDVESYMRGWNDAIDAAVDSIPTITITFCPHCIHRRRYYNGQTWCALDDRPITDNDFCSFGKEKCDE